MGNLQYILPKMQWLLLMCFFFRGGDGEGPERVQIDAKYGVECVKNMIQSHTEHIFEILYPHN